MAGWWKQGASAVWALMFVSSTAAHVVDEYLQATILYIEPTGVRLLINLTPGTEVADKVIARIDHNADGVIAPDETAAYAEQVRRDLTLYLDGREMGLKVQACDVPKPDEMRSGWGIITLEFFAVGAIPAGTNKLTMVNRHMPDISVYLFNAGFPSSGSIRVLGQERNLNQSEGEIEFTYQPATKRLQRLALPAVCAVLAALVLVNGIRRKWRVHNA